MARYEGEPLLSAKRRLTWLVGVNMNREISFTKSGNPEAALPLLEDAFQTYSEL